MDWTSGIMSLIGSISKEIQESQKLNATIQDAKTSLVEKLNALNEQYTQLLKAKETLQQAVQIAEQESQQSQNQSQIDYVQVGLYFGIGLIGSVLLRKLIKK